MIGKISTVYGLWAVSLWVLSWHLIDASCQSHAVPNAWRWHFVGSLAHHTVVANPTHLAPTMVQQEPLKLFANGNVTGCFCVLFVCGYCCRGVVMTHTRSLSLYLSHSVFSEQTPLMQYCKELDDSLQLFMRHRLDLYFCVCECLPCATLSAADVCPWVFVL